MAVGVGGVKYGVRKGVEDVVVGVVIFEVGGDLRIVGVGIVMNRACGE